jgi:uncharacterized protein YkwD
VACALSTQRPTHRKTVDWLIVGVALLAAASPARADEAAERRARAEIAELIGEERARHGAPQLDRVPSLGRAATAHAADMVVRGFFSHLSPEGSRLIDRVRATGYLDGWTTWEVGEVLAWGDGELGTPATAMRLWLESPPHRRAVNRRAYRELGVGVAEGTPAGDGGATYAVVLGGRGRR